MIDGLGSSRALLLNASFEPMKVVSWQKALILWFQDKVDVLEFHQTVVRSVRQNFRVPSVLKLKQYIQPRSRNVVRFCRENVYIRDEFTCQYCGDQHSPRALTLDHVLPVSKQGPSSWTNVVTACRPCNQKKGNRTPEKANMPLKKKPVQPDWLPASSFESRHGETPETWLPYIAAYA